ncbi:MAG: MMPL family transporter [Chloroflexi bacterium]|nr:MMPL family transporter [Chloroflexota bacterium]
MDRWEQALLGNSRPGRSRLNPSCVDSTAGDGNAFESAGRIYPEIRRRIRRNCPPHSHPRSIVLTEALARAGISHPWLTIAAWLVALVIGLGLNATLLASATTTELTLGGGVESDRAADILEQARGPDPLLELIVVQGEGTTVADPAFQAKVESVTAEVVGLGPDIVTGAANFYLTGDPTQVSPDQSATIIHVVLAGDFQEASEHVGEVLEVIEAQNQDPAFEVLMGGPASISFEQNELATHDLEQGERVGVPVAMVILLFLFGTVVATLVPLGLAIVAIVVALGVVALIGQVFELVFFVTLMITMIGLAVGIDYSLLIITRFREELDHGLDVPEAVERAGATAGRTVLFSGLTVVIALLGMLIVPAAFFRSLGIGAILVVLVALAATLTLLPAVLTLLGTKINRLPLPFVGRRRSSGADAPGGFWDAITRVVTRHPVISVAAVGIPMVVATAFYFQIETGLSGVDTFPEGTQTRLAFEALEEEFSFGLVNPAEIVIDADLTDPQVAAAIEALQASIVADPHYPLPPLLIPSPSGDLAVLEVFIPGEPSSQTAVDALAILKDTHISAAFAGVPGEVLIAGTTSITADLFDVVDFYTPIVFAFVLGFSFIVLMLVFRSIVIPIKAVIMNLLSVGTAYGLLVLVFQKGVARDLLGFNEAPSIDVWIPLFLFSILFGLSMDYHVFLLSRIRERFDQSGDNAEAVAYGLRSTAQLITGAALIMVAVFGAFASGQTIVNQQVGFGLAVAVFLDATLVRSVLVPASMELLGGRNWYLPPFLAWLPDLRIEPAED